ncbi:RluA family pseudouridine synthase [Candidatus Ruminimicrobiellum ovillum]|uniref:RluA family pseudouridine synthase n=1 Tax=Candidatus Ruminimicrobiellum ovillum TaxID=1947927 RepID=UPI00355A0CCB
MENKKFNILFENDDVIVINKEPEIFVINNEENKSKTIKDILQEKLKKEIIPVTSLDYEASGIVIFAKNQKTYDFISEQFKKEKVKKIYHILINGIMENSDGEIDKNLSVNEQTTSVNDKGIKSVTKYKVLEQFKNFAFVEVYPLTTRKNQIRAHFWSIGNTLAIDKIYGSEEPILLSNLKRRYKGISKEKPLLKRLPIHLSQIEVLLPENKDKSIFTSQLPNDIQLTLKQLRKYNKRG